MAAGRVPLDLQAIGIRVVEVVHQLRRDWKRVHGLCIERPDQPLCHHESADDSHCLERLHRLCPHHRFRLGSICFEMDTPVNRIISQTFALSHFSWAPEMEKNAKMGSGFLVMLNAEFSPVMDLHVQRQI
jgi:hypothetical protein